MSGASAGLPAGFEALEPFVSAWAAPTAAERSRLRLASCAADREAFFEAAKDLIAPALAVLDRKRRDQFDATEQRLMDLVLAFAHVAQAVEIQAEDEPKHARNSRAMRITRAPSDRDA
jgi:hypothetical protein